jgi:hypothetical protein
LKSGSWDLLKEKGFKVREAEKHLGLSAESPIELPYPDRYKFLAVHAYERGELTEKDRFLPILTVLGHAWYLPAAVEREAHSYRQPDPGDPANLVVAPIDLQPAFASGVLQRCDCASQEELDLYVELAAKIEDDGESMGLAIAKCRKWKVVSDDKKARRIAKELGVQTWGTPEIMKSWATRAKPTIEELSAVLKAIERFSNDRPMRSAIEYPWWIESTRRQ